MLLGELLNRDVVTEGGYRFGRVHDVRGALFDGHLRVTGLVAGRLGIFERYGIGSGGGPAGRPKVHGHAVIPWARVARIGPEIVLRD